MVGAILLVSALIFGALAGGVVVQRLNSSPATSNGHHDPQEADESQDKDA